MEATTTSTSTTRESLAETLREDVRRVRLESVDWSVYAQAGVLVKISIGVCNYATKMKLEDWGLVNLEPEERKAYERTCSFGYRNLIPRERIMDPILSVQQRGRSCVEKYAIPTTWGHFIPVAKYAAWRAENDKLREEFLKLQADLDQNWDAYIAEMDNDYMTVARRNYRALVAQGVVLDLSAEEYGLAALARSKRRSQTKIAAMAAFRWEWQTTGLPFDPDAEKAFRAARESGDVLKADLNRTRMETEAGGLKTFVADLTEQVRGEVYRVVVDVLTALRKNGGKLPPSSTSQLRKLIETVQDMMFWPDAELEDRMTQVRGLIDVPADSRSGDQIQQAMVALGVEMRSYLLEIDRPPKRSGAEFGIPDARKDLANFRRRKANRLDLTAAPVTEIAKPPRRARKPAEPVETEPFIGPVLPDLGSDYAVAS